jgi:hypothetical protein
MDTMTTPRNKARRNDPRGLESERMVREAYEAIAAIHTVPPVRKGKALEHHAIATLNQMVQMNLITSREMMERMEMT